MTPRPQPRHFSTVTKVYPPYLPYLHVSRGRSRRWVAPIFTVATVSIGTGIVLSSNDNRSTIFTFPTPLVASRIQPRASADVASETEQVLRNKKLLDAYGDRTSLEELEEAVRIYEQAGTQT